MDAVRVEIVVGSRSGRLWHERLFRRLENLPNVQVSLTIRHERAGEADRMLGPLLKLEQKISGTDAGLAEVVDLGQTLLPAANREAPAEQDYSEKVVLDLTANPSKGSWSVVYDGKPGESSAVDSLRSGRQPVVSVVDEIGVVRAKGRPGTENPGLMTTALGDLGAGVVTLVVGALTGTAFAAPWVSDEGGRRPRRYLEIAARRVLSQGVRNVYRALYRAPHWRVGWRQKTGRGDLLGGGVLADRAWRDLTDDGFHFYADPFLFEHRGLLYLFVEDFSHREGKAVISVVQMGDEGPMGVPQPVLEHDVHLSYPFVLSHDGDVWMIPESSGARTLELYRAVDFPWKWELHSVLLEGEQISDATFFTHKGRWWLTATVGYGGSLSDSLCLWSAPDLRGPWSPNEKNPVLVDIASARPAGRVELRDGLLLRPFQDGRQGYGAHMGVAQITRLDDGGFEQEVLAHFSAGDGWAGTRIHTFNQAGNLEVVDGSGFAPKFWFARMRPLL